MSELETDPKIRAMSLQALIAPVVAVLLILAGVVLSVLLAGASLQNESEAIRSQHLIDTAFRSIGRDLGHLAERLAESRQAAASAGASTETWDDSNLSDLRSDFGAVDVIVVGPGNEALYSSEKGQVGAVPEVTDSIKGLVVDARQSAEQGQQWISAYVMHENQLHVAGASGANTAGLASGDALVVLREVDEELLRQISDDFLIDNIEVHPPDDIQGRVGIVISAPGGEKLAAISWTPPQPGDELFDYLLKPILIASLIAALLLATFLRTATRAAEQLKQGAVALAASGERLEYSESILSAIIHGVADGIATIDASGKITSANVSMTRIFGYEAGEMLGRPAAMLVAGAETGDVDPGGFLLAEPASNETMYRECTGLRKDGGRFVLDIAVSHITYQSKAVAIAIMRDVTERRQAEETLNLLSTGMALVDRDCQLLLANRTASRLLESGDGLRLSYGRVSAARRDQVDQLRDLVDAVCSDTGVGDDEGAGVMTIERGESVRPLSIKIAPVQLHAGEGASKVAAIFIRDPEIRQSVPPEVVAKLFGLTLAEARVVVELVKGKRPQEVAEEIGVSLNTVRNQLKQIFSKTSTGRQSELISLVLSSAAFVSEHGLGVEEDDGEDGEIQLTGS